MTVFWVVWDGAASWITDALLDRGRLPHLAAVRAGGWGGGVEPSRPSCQTPPGLATLFTGTPPSEHGVTGFWVPGAPDGDLSGSARGFEPGVCRRPPLWDRLALSGVRSLLLHAPWAFAADGSVGQHVAGAVEAYSRRVARERAEVVPLGRSVVWADLGAAVTMRATSYEGARVELTAPGAAPVRLGDEWTAVGGPGLAAAWYRTVRTGAGTVCVRSGAWRPRVAGSDPELVARLDEATAERPFVGDSMGALLRDGAFGAPLASGGDGSAEAVFLSGARLLADGFAALVRAALADGDLPELVVVYLPVTDDVGHELVGLLEPSADLAADVRGTAWELVADGYGLADELLGAVLERAGATDTVVVSADHGMAPVTTTFYPNNVLVEVGLAVPAPDRSDGADHHASQALYHLAANGLVLRGGRAQVDGAPEADPLAQAHQALLDARHPGTGQPGVVGLVDEHGEPVPVGTTGAVLVPAPGVLPWPDVTEGLPAFGPPLRSASHTTYAGDPRLHATAAVRGPVLVDGTEPPLRRNDQVADLITRAIVLERERAPVRPARQLRLCVMGLSGAGKSTFVAIAREVCADRGLRLEHVRLASPLYRLQEEVRVAAGVGAREDQQDQLLMESLARHLRRLNPRALIDPVLTQLEASTADVVLNDDLRHAEVDAVELRRHGFVLVRVEAPDDVRRARLALRGDATVSDASTSDLYRVLPDRTLHNDGTPEDYRRHATELLEVLLDPHRC